MRDKPTIAQESFQEAERTVTHAMGDSDQAAKHLEDAQRAASLPMLSERGVTPISERPRRARSESRPHFVKRHLGTGN